MSNAHRMGGKLDYSWKGPYTVLEDLGKGRYRLQTGDGKKLRKVINGVLLKDYLDPTFLPETSKTASSPSVQTNSQKCNKVPKKRKVKKKEIWLFMHVIFKLHFCHHLDADWWLYVVKNVASEAMFI